MSNEMISQSQGTSGMLVDTGFMMSLSELKLRANMVGQLKRELMVDKVHFGTIPGCGDKPTLLKNGAELLCMAFRLASGTHADINDLGNGHREYTVTTTLTSGGELVATGIGSCSTMETSTVIVEASLKIPESLFRRNTGTRKTPRPLVARALPRRRMKTVAG